MRELVVGTLRISRTTAEKLQAKHGLDADSVRAAVEGVGGLPFYWTHDPQRGDRAIVVAVIDDQECQVVLYPAWGEGPETWNLGSAYPR